MGREGKGSVDEVGRKAQPGPAPVDCCSSVRDEKAAAKSASKPPAQNILRSVSEHHNQFMYQFGMHK